MLPHTDHSILLVLSAEQSSRLRGLIDSTDVAPICRPRTRRRGMRSGFWLFTLVLLVWLGGEVASLSIQWAANFIQWAANAPIP